MESRYMIRCQNDRGTYLMHSAAKPKTERPGHKYLLRLISNLGTRYFYTMDQIRAYYKNRGKKDPYASNVPTTYTQTGANVHPWTDQKQDEVQVETKGEKFFKGLKDKADTLFGNKKEAPKNVVESARSKGQAGLEKKSEEPKRPEGRKRNVTGTADPIIKKPIEAAKADSSPTDIPVEALKDHVNSEYIKYYNTYENMDPHSEEAKQYKAESLSSMMRDSAAVCVGSAAIQEEKDKEFRKQYDQVHQRLEEFKNDSEISSANKLQTEQVLNRLENYLECLDKYEKYYGKQFSDYSVDYNHDTSEDEVYRNYQQAGLSLTTAITIFSANDDWKSTTLAMEVLDCARIGDQAIECCDDIYTYMSVVSYLSDLWHEDLTEEDWQKYAKKK